VRWFPPVGGVFIGVQGGVTDLVKMVASHVVADWPSHVAGRPQDLASTDFRLWIPCYRLLDSVTVKPTRKRLQSRAGHIGVLAGWPLPGPLVSGLCTLPPRVRYITGVTLIFLEFQISM
jgi:hypothetical protein